MGQERKSRTWTIYSTQFDTDAEFRAAVEQELVDLFVIGYRGRRGVIFAPLFMEDDTGEFVTIGFAFEEVFMPAVRRAEPEEALAQAAEAATEDAPAEPAEAREPVEV